LLRKDLILRQLEEFGKALAQILLYKKQKEYDKFEEEITLVLKKYSSLELTILENLNTPDFTTQVILNESISFEQKKIIASVLFEKMLYYEELGLEDNNKELVDKCFKFYTWLYTNQTENEFNMEVHYRLELLKKLVT
jgi:uncharacterized protein with von Willebrand factor type A (vWA) domain